MVDAVHKEQEQKMLELLREAVKHDEALREQYQLGNKFRFVRDNLQALLKHVESHVVVVSDKTADEELVKQVGADETVVYVYLYNAQGMNVRTWQKMLIPKVFAEYSVNRPIYAEKAHIESMIKAKSNIAQHAFLKIAVKNSDIIKVDGENKDPAGFPLVKIRERSLHFQKLLSFTHANQEYSVSDNGELKHLPFA